MANQIYVIMDDTADDYPIPAGAYFIEEEAVAELDVLRDACDLRWPEKCYWLETVQVYGNG